MSSKRKSPVDGLALPLPPSKRQKVTVLSKCYICQKDVPGNPLRKGKSSSIVNLLESAKCRGDDVYVRLCKDGVEPVEDLVEVVWHSACYSSYTSKRNIQFASSIDTNDAASEEECEDQERASRSSDQKSTGQSAFLQKEDLQECDRIDKRFDVHSLPDHQEGCYYSRRRSYASPSPWS